MQQKNSKLSGGTILSFFASLIILSIVIGIMFLYSPTHSSWYKSPANITLIVAGLIICFLAALVVQTKSELRKMNSYFDNFAITDPLTNIYNRRYVDENINRLVKSVSRSDSILTVMMIDLDLFKNYNETYGHSKGDKCLTTMANILTQTVKRDNDFVARYGGEEFIIIMPNTDESGAKKIADRLFENIRDRNIPHGKSSIADRLTISIGVTTGGGKDYSHTGDDFINKANEALQMSKQAGRNRYTVLNLQ